jgi:PAS domain S-box-containing protein
MAPGEPRGPLLAGPDQRLQRVEDRLRQSVALLQATLDATLDGFLVVDLAGRIVSYNRRFMEIWGVPQEVLEGRDDQRALKHVLERLENPAGFLDRVEAGRGRSRLFDRTMHDEAVARLELETSLRRAVERQEFVLHFQPIISLSTGRLVGLESLLRWQHPERGLLLPAEFLAMAEDTGLIIPIGLWALEEAARYLARWWDPVAGAPYMAVNLSPTQLTQPDLIYQLKGILTRCGAPARGFRLELTENVLMEQAEAAVRAMAGLRALGIALVIDDFGTGYSSLSYLHRFAAHALKIDRTFISLIGRNGENSEIVRSILALADEMGIEVVAEGVETLDQLRMVRILGCGAGQGFHLGRPVPAEVAEAALRRVWDVH